MCCSVHIGAPQRGFHSLRDRSLHVTAASLNLKRPSLVVHWRQVLFCLLDRSQSPAPTPASPHPSSSEPSGEQSSFYACHCMPTQTPPCTPSWGPDRVMASMWLKGGGVRLQLRVDKKRRSTLRQGAKTCVLKSHCTRHSSRSTRQPNWKPPPPDAPLRLPAMQVIRPKACGYRPLDTHVWVGLFYRRGSL